MRTHSNLLVLAAAAVLCYAAVAAPAPAAVPGGWMAINNVTDPHVQELGEWAVAAHTKVVDDGLRFHRVVSGAVQIVAGVNYRLDVDALRLDGKDAMYRAVVFEQDWPTTLRRELVSFQPAANKTMT